MLRTYPKAGEPTAAAVRRVRELHTDERAREIFEQCIEDYVQALRKAWRAGFFQGLPGARPILGTVAEIKEEIRRERLIAAGIRAQRKGKGKAA